MPSRVALAVVVAALGVALLLNPLYLYPDGGGEQAWTYEAERIDGEEAATEALFADDDVLTCPGERACRLESEVREQGSLEYDGLVRDGQRYEVVGLDPGWYVPRNEFQDGSTTLTLEEVGAEAAVEHVAVPVDERPPAVREAVETGSATVVGERIAGVGEGEVVVRDGEHYAVRPTERRSHWTGDGGLAIARLVLLVGGCAALVVAGGLLREESGLLE